MDFSGIADACEIGWACRFDAPKYMPANTRTHTVAILAISSGFGFEVLPGDVFIRAGPDGSWGRCATSTADCGRRNGFFARQSATVFSQVCGTNAGSMSNSFRRSVIEGAIRSQICRSMLPE